MFGEPLVVLLVEDNPDHAELVMRSLVDFNVANKNVPEEYRMKFASTLLDTHFHLVSRIHETIFGQLN